MSLSRDSVLFPSEAYQELCIENQKVLRGEWEPKFGDWVHLVPHDLYHFERGIVVFGAGDEDIVMVRTDDVQHLLLHIHELIPLFQPRQLRQALESEGYAVCLTGPYMLPKNYQAILAKEDNEAIVEYGPDPATALLKAYLEVMSQGGKEE